MAEKREIIVQQTLRDIRAQQGGGLQINPDSVIYADSVAMAEHYVMLPPLEFPGLREWPIANGKRSMLDGVKNIRHFKKPLPNIQKTTMAWLANDAAVNPLAVDITYLSVVNSNVNETPAPLLMSLQPKETLSALYAMTYNPIPSNPIDIYDYYGNLFWRVAQCLKVHKDDVCIIVGSGDLNEILSDFDQLSWEGHEQSRIETFNRMDLGNEPDQFGVLASMLVSAPYADMEEHLGCEIRYIVMNNIFAWKNFQQYGFSNTLLKDMSEAQELFGLCNIGVRGATMDKRPRWSITDKVERPGRQKVVQYLHRLFLAICFPVERNIDPEEIEYTPMTFNVMFMAMQRMYTLGVPAHWLSQIVTEILTCETFNSTSREPLTSPNDIKTATPSTLVRSFHIGTFRQELLALASLWASRSSFFLILCPLPLDVTRYVIPQKEIDDCCGCEADLESFRKQTMSPSVTILLCPIDAVPSASMFRKLVMNGCSKDFHFFSALMKTASDDGVKFTVSRSFMNSLKFKDWCAVVARMDSWDLLFTPIQLEKLREHF